MFNYHIIQNHAPYKPTVNKT